MKSSKVFWGIFFILAAVYVIISKFGILPDIGVFSIILTVFFLWLFVEGIRNVNFWEILFSIAFICIIYDERLELQHSRRGRCLVRHSLGASVCHSFSAGKSGNGRR